MNLQPEFHFRRFEIKYLTDEDTAENIKKDLMPYLKHDPFADQEAKEYEVTLDGYNSSKKIRVRCYRTGGQIKDNAFLEIKRKEGVIVVKDRIRLNLEELRQFQKTDTLLDSGRSFSPKEENFIKEYEFERVIRALSPKILVTYTREPYAGVYDEGLRVTFDRNIKAAQNDNLFYDGGDMERIHPGEVVVEIKFRRGLPVYMGETIKKFSMIRVPFSKYRKGMEETRAIPGSFPGITRGFETVSYI